MAQDYGSLILENLLKMVDPRNSFTGQLVGGASRAAGAAAGTQVGQNPAQGMGQAVLELGPYQKGLQKALTKAGESHAQEALAAGVTPDHIENQAGLNQTPIQGQQAVAPQATQALPQILSPKGPFEGASADAAGNVYQRGVGMNVLATLLPGLFGGAQSASQVIGQQQGMTQSGPGQVALKTAEAQQIPPTQYEQSSLAAGGYTAQVTAINDELQRIQADKQNQVEQMKALMELRNPLEKGFGQPSGQINQIQKNLKALNEAEVEVHQKMVDLFGKHPNLKTGARSAEQSKDGFQTTPSGVKWKIKK